MQIISIYREFCRKPNNFIIKVGSSETIREAHELRMMKT